MMGKTVTALIAFQDTYVPFTIHYRHLELRCYPHKPRSQQCQTCLKLGDRTEVCPKKGTLTVCNICKKQKQKNIAKTSANKKQILKKKHITSDTFPNCVPYCIICRDDHPSKDPHCPAKKQA
ncbi:unnamed protein product, partial [Ixodes pacificus]